MMALNYGISLRKPFDVVWLYISYKRLPWLAKLGTFNIATITI
jgi:hypothetical protein